jgi:hypothetical protein
VIVTAPRSAGKREIAAFLEGHRQWIDDTVARIDAEKRNSLPDAIDLTAVSKSFCVQYVQRDSQYVELRQRNDTLLVTGPVGDIEAVSELLRRWLSDRAREQLIPCLQEISRELELTFSGTSIRGQKTRWASCSSKGAISINRNMLFLPPRLVRFVFIHELCHTVRMDHSPRFWKLVEEREPETAALRKQLRAANALVPAWAR